jgi:hypothetical protein
MLFKNECGHEANEYIFSVGNKSRGLDVCLVKQRPNEFCLRYGNKDYEYLSSITCGSIERRIDWFRKYGEDGCNDGSDSENLFLLCRNLLRSTNLWDIEWNLDLEIIELGEEVKEYNDAIVFRLA